MSFLSRLIQSVASATNPASLKTDLPRRWGISGRDAGTTADRPSPRERFPCFGAPISAELEKSLAVLTRLGMPGTLRQREAPRQPGQGRWTSKTFTSAAGSRDYWLFVPNPDRSVTALVVMLHGCTQTAVDFAAGTRMNERALETNVAIAYPEQPQTANLHRCWNWFDPANQDRDGVEPTLLAGLAGTVAESLGVPPARTFVAGLSAGAAMAVILAETHPEVFAAAGIHSGLPYRAAHDLASALAVMASGSAPSGRPARAPRPTIVFHGDADPVVNIANGQAIMTRLKAGFPGLTITIEDGDRHDRAFRRVIGRDKAGRLKLEFWTLIGAGHAWSGGSPQGSYTDPKGPDASAEMLRFFLESA